MTCAPKTHPKHAPRQDLTRLIPCLTYGSEPLLEVVLAEYRPYLSWSAFDETGLHSERASSCQRG